MDGSPASLNRLSPEAGKESDRRCLEMEASALDGN
jgi:hypothetical protein